MARLVRLIPLWLVLAAPIAGGAERTWTDVSGRSMRAEFVREARGEVTFLKGGKLVTVPLDKLSEKDQKIVRDLAAGKPVPDEPARSNPGETEPENPFKPVDQPAAEDENPFKAVDQSKVDEENPFKPVDSNPADDNPFKPVTKPEPAEESPFKPTAPAAADPNDPFRPVERQPESERPLKPTPAATGQGAGAINSPKTTTTQPATAADTARPERPKPASSLTKKPVSPKPRGWAYRSGRTTTGKFVRIHNGNVVILRGTRTVTIPYYELSDADQAYVKDLLTSMGEEHLIPPPLPEGQAGGEQGLAAGAIGGGQGVGGGAVGGGAAGGRPGSRNLAGTGSSGISDQDIDRSGGGPTSDRMRSSDFDQGASQREGMESSIDRMRERSDQLSDEHGQRRDELRQQMEEQRNQFDAARDQIEAERERLRQEREQEREAARQNEYVAECLQCKRRLTRADSELTSCPHCGVTWDYEIDQFGMRRSLAPGSASASSGASSSPSAASQMTPETQKMVASVVVIAILGAIALAIVIGVIVIAVAIASASSTSKQRRYV